MSQMNQKPRGPIVVTSPAPRCGTTLVQRLLASSPDVNMYGEALGQQVRIMIHEAQQQTMFAAANAKQFGPDDWNPAAPPSAEDTLRIWTGALWGMAVVMSENGTKRWGFKYPALETRIAQGLLEVFPDTQFIYVTRDPIDVLRSVKARGWFEKPSGYAGEEVIRNMCGNWKERDKFFQADGRNSWTVNYEDLIENPAEVSAIEAVLGMTGIDLSVMKTKVNTFAGKDSGHDPDQYVHPVDLTDEERKIVEECLGKV